MDNAGFVALVARPQWRPILDDGHLVLTWSCTLLLRVHRRGGQIPTTRTGMLWCICFRPAPLVLDVATTGGSATERDCGDFHLDLWALQLRHSSAVIPSRLPPVLPGDRCPGARPRIGDINQTLAIRISAGRSYRTHRRRTCTVFPAGRPDRASALLFTGQLTGKAGAPGPHWTTVRASGLSQCTERAYFHRNPPPPPDATVVIAWTGNVPEGGSALSSPAL